MTNKKLFRAATLYLMVGTVVYITYGLVQITCGLTGGDSDARISRALWYLLFFLRPFNLDLVPASISGVLGFGFSEVGAFDYSPSILGYILSLFIGFVLGPLFFDYVRYAYHGHSKEKHSMVTILIFSFVFRITAIYLNFDRMRMLSDTTTEKLIYYLDIVGLVMAITCTIIFVVYAPRETYQES